MQKHTLFDKNKTLNCRGKLISLEQVKIMGILNVTPDSFYDGGQYNNVDSAYLKIHKMIQEGVDIIDIGAMSSRPGAEVISSEKEIERLKPLLLDGLIEKFPDIIFSIDTIHSSTANFAMEQGFHIINDISGGKIDTEIIDIAAEFSSPYILMHMKGQPKNMQNDLEYKDIMVSITDFFIEQIEVCKTKGIKDIVLDPGIGFGKSLDDNYKILRSLKDFDFLNLPILIGVSRKSLVTNLLNIKSLNSLNATSILNFYSIINGANILRVHDIKEAKEAVTLAKQLMN